MIFSSLIAWKVKPSNHLYLYLFFYYTLILSSVTFTGLRYETQSFLKVLSCPFSCTDLFLAIIQADVFLRKKNALFAVCYLTADKHQWGCQLL